MKKILRQTALGFGTFGTGCALLALNVNPYLLVLTDTVVGVGMLFAAGSISVNDLPLKRRGALGGDEAAPAESVPGAGDEPQAGLMASLGKLKGSLKPPAGVKGKEVQEAKVKEIDRMLDSTLAGPSKRLISLAEGKGPSAAPAAAAGAAAGSTGHGEDLLEQFSKSEIGIPFGEDDEEAGPGLPGQTGPEAGMLEARPGQLTMAAEVTGEAPVEVPSHPVEGLGADDLLSALRLEAMKEKKKDDTSLVRDLHGVKVTGKELVDELSSLVRNMRGR